jgi:hypothetical protein
MDEAGEQYRGGDNTGIIAAAARQERSSSGGPPLPPPVAHAAAAGGGSAAAGTRVQQLKALVVGIQDYLSIDKLKSPVYDARAVEGVLTRLGFTVTLLVDVTQDKLLTGVKNFIKDVQGGDTVVTYFSCHGVASGDAGVETYVLPTDFLHGDRDCLRDNLVAHALGVDTMVVKPLEDRRARLNVVVLDCCRESHVAGGKGLPSGAAFGVPHVKSGTLVAMACAPGAYALENPGGGLSQYTAKMIPLLEEWARSKDISLIFRDIAMAVETATARERVPMNPWHHECLREYPALLVVPR